MPEAEIVEEGFLEGELGDTTDGTIPEAMLEPIDDVVPATERDSEEAAVDMAGDESVLLSEASFALAQDDEIASAAEAAAAAADSDTGNGWRRLARSLSHEIRNPLVSIRTFAELLPDHYDDETFRERFVELVGHDVAHIGDVLTPPLERG